jgi:hemerythrin superfamily protein
MAQARKKAKAKAAPDAVDMLLMDHVAVDGLFRQFEKLHEAEKDTNKVIDAVRIALTIHDALEMEIFYPAVRKVAGEDEEELLDEAEVEHGSVQMLLAALRPGKLNDKKREANFTVLLEYVRHHVKEEENELFPKLKKLKGLNTAALGERMMTRRIALEKKLIK